MFKIYWTDFTNTPQGIYTSTLNGALRLCEEKRREGFTFVTMVSENPHCTSKVGVDEVTDTANYDGWISRGRAP